MEDFTAAEVRAQLFRSAMRGYDQAEVRAYLERLASYLDAVQQQLHLAGIGEVSAVSAPADYGAVGDEIAGVLEEARAAADTMRARAAADVAEWRSQARADAEQARGDAWDAGVAMLSQVTAECEALIGEAEEISLRLRAEAERDAARMVTDAQREREELARAGREEAEKTVSAARKEADSLLMAARHQADVAHERTRALEARRAELMADLESTQKALLGLDDADQAPAAEPEPPQREESRSHWPDDDGVVRIVERPRPIAPEPVDADALAAEVRAMRKRSEPVSPPAEAPERAAVVEAEPEVAVEPETEADVVEPEPEPEAEVVEPAPEAEAEEVEPEPEPEPEAAVEPEPEAAVIEPDPLAGLFDALRTPAPADSPNGQQESAASSVAVLTESEPAEAAVRSTPDPFALRDRLLLPVQNRALREVKRQLVSAQNHALEELRLDPEWMPEPTIADGEISGALADLVGESTAAGIAAAAELLGDPQMAAVEIEPAEPDLTFSRAFVTSIAETLDRSRSAGAGKRELSSSLSRVFRAWRTDDAERRIRMLSRSAYHRGLLAALDAAGCASVHIVLLDRSCVDHSDTAAPWAIATGPPAGILIPPASLECSCTVVPDC